MFLTKIKTGASGIVTYGITPPRRSETDPVRLAEIAEKTIARISPLDIDALIVYDVQDESARTSVERPYPFTTAHDPFEFASTYLRDLDIPKIIYRPAGKFAEQELIDWLGQLDQHHFHPVFVGVPSPDVEVKTTLPEAYALWSTHSRASALGAVTIPERHATYLDEDKRILQKAGCGVSYFVSQCVFNVDYAKKMIADLSHTCRQQKAPVPTIIFTLAACGSVKTLEFMEWLGIHLPENVRTELLSADNMLDKCVGICLDTASQIIEHCTEHSIPFGFNIESVAIKKAEIEASIYMVNQISEMLEEKGIRKKIPVTVI